MKKIIRHPHLVKYVYFESFKAIKYNTIAMLLLGLFSFYPEFIMAFDLTLTILLLLFWFIFLPIVSKGDQFPIYYRKYYADTLISEAIKFLFLPGAVVRTFWFSLYYVIYFFASRSDPYEAVKLSLQVKEILFSIQSHLVAISVFLFIIYYFFYMKKEISVYKLTNCIREYMKFGYSMRDAFYKYFEDEDRNRPLTEEEKKMLELKEMHLNMLSESLEKERSIKQQKNDNDHSVKKIYIPVNDHHTSNTQAYVPQESQIQVSIDNHATPIRRKSRRTKIDSESIRRKNKKIGRSG